MMGRRIVAALMSTSALLLGVTAPALAADRGWGMTGVLSGFESSYWDTASGTTTIRVDSCGSQYNLGVTYSSTSLVLWENLAWQPDINRGSRGYACAANGGSIYGGSQSWAHVNGRFYFSVGSTPGNFRMNANGNTNYPG